jgi:type IV pilus assembly protein PilC
MNLLLNARTRLVHALELVNKMVGFYPIEKSLQQIVGEVEKGQSLYKSLSQYEIYPSHLISLIKIAEEVNKLDEMFGRLAKQYSDEVEHEMGLLSSVLEPVIMIFLGFFVIIILVAMYLPMFQMGMGVH